VIVVVETGLRSHRVVRFVVPMHDTGMVAVRGLRDVDVLSGQNCQRQEATPSDDRKELLRDAAEHDEALSLRYDRQSNVEPPDCTKEASRSHQVVSVRIHRRRHHRARWIP
jgi:hypothetical protein